MSMISTLLLIQPEAGVRAELQSGFEREGIDVVVADGDGVAAAIAGSRPQLVVTGVGTEPEALEVLGSVRAALKAAKLETPVLYLGNGVRRDRALAGGASEVVESPAQIRDVVTLGRLAVSGSGGKLADLAGLYDLIRAMAAAHKTCVLTLTRGLRRGELRFHDGEVTSAQAGLLHGVAALHQLILWSDAHFELRSEETVPRRQIPLSTPELLLSCERFLEEVREVGGGMSPAHAYEQSREVDADLLADLPPPIGAVLRLFDGSRTLGDVVEDSPFRVFETLRVIARLRSIGLIASDQASARRSDGEPSIDEWLAGVEGPAPKPPAGDSVDWSDVLPRPAPPVEPEAISQVVPATSATGELETSAGAQSAAEADRPEETIIVEGEDAES